MLHLLYSFGRWHTRQRRFITNCLSSSCRWARAKKNIGMEKQHLAKTTYLYYNVVYYIIEYNSSEYDAVLIPFHAAWRNFFSLLRTLHFLPSHVHHENIAQRVSVIVRVSTMEMAINLLPKATKSISKSISCVSIIITVRGEASSNIHLQYTQSLFDVEWRKANKNNEQQQWKLALGWLGMANSCHIVHCCMRRRTPCWSQ